MQIFILVVLIISGLLSGACSAPSTPARVSPTTPVAPEAQFDKITFMASRAEGSYDCDIYSMDMDGIHLLDLTHGSGDTNRDPDWSPDGTKIAFSSLRESDFQIYIMNDDGSNVKRLTFGLWGAVQPSWSPDGGKIAFVGVTDDENSDIYVMNADGSKMTRLTDNIALDGSPCWSPDGTKIAFYSGRDYNDEIYVMNADGSNQVNLTNNPNSSDRDPSWSPYGTKIAYSSRLSGRDDEYYGIYIMDIDGTHQTKLATGLVASGEPS